MFVQEEALASSLSSTDSLPPEDHRPIARACSDSLESIPAGQVMPSRAPGDSFLGHAAAV